MNDDLKAVQTPVNQIQDTVVSSPVAQPVGNPVKESEPLSNSVSSSEQEMVISDELKEIGVEAVSERPQLTPEHAEIGIRVSDKPVESVPQAAPTPVNFKTPLSDEEMIMAPKRSIFDAIRWLADLVSRQFKRARFNQEQTSSGRI